MTVTIERNNDHLIMRLNRPQALNALNFEMIQILSRAIDEIEQTETLCGGVLLGEGGKAFCAGGDIKIAREMAMAGRIDDSMEFFKAEYALNKKMFHSSKPLLAMMNGVTMGGGVGISASCRYRVATPKTLWAMPEVGIGFFPDVGGAYYLSRMPNKYGLYLGMTGARVSNPAHLLWAGIATHIVAETSPDKILSSLKSFADIDSILKSHALPTVPEQPPVWNFDYTNDRSPLSVTVAEKHITRAADENFDQVIARDLILARKFMAEPDFIEGVRAAVVDKDRNPKWQKTMSEFTQFNFDQYLN